LHFPPLLAFSSLVQINLIPSRIHATTKNNWLILKIILSDYSVARVLLQMATKYVHFVIILTFDR